MHAYRFLVITAIVASTSHQSLAQATAAPTVTIRVAGQTHTVVASQLDRLPQQSLRLQERAETSIVSGPSLWDVIQSVGAVPTRASGRQRGVMYLRVTGADGQNAVIALVEIDPSFSNRSAILMARRNGKPLDAVEGPWRLVLPEDLRHARWIRGVVAISVESLP